METTREEKLGAMLGRILFDIDYTAGRCRPNEMIAALVDEDTIREAAALVEEFDADRRAGKGE
jgi:hypothetical protein